MTDQLLFESSTGNKALIKMLPNRACNVGWINSPSKTDMAECDMAMEKYLNAPVESVQIEDETARAIAARAYSSGSNN